MSHLGWKPHANIFTGSYASSLPRARLCFKIWELCSSLNVVMYSFCVSSTRSKLRTKSWSVFFSSSPFDLSRAKAKIITQERKVPREANFGKAAILTDEVPIAKVKRNEANCSSTTEGSKERLGKSNGEEDKKMLQDLVRSLERVLGTHEYMTTFREEHNSHILKQRRALGNNDA